MRCLDRTRTVTMGTGFRSRALFRTAALTVGTRLGFSYLNLFFTTECRLFKGKVKSCP